MAICLPCNHTVDEEASHWAYKDVTFHFCSLSCEQQVKEDPERWLAVAKSETLKGDAPHHGHRHHD